VRGERDEGRARVRVRGGSNSKNRSKSESKNKSKKRECGGFFVRSSVFFEIIYSKYDGIHWFRLGSEIIKNNKSLCYNGFNYGSENLLI
jgi:hypothetical protein